MLYDTNLHSLKLLHKGKVRDTYEVDNQHLLMVTTDRISAFDVILHNGIPHKGKILNQMSLFWFEFLAQIIPNHLSLIKVENVVTDQEYQIIKNQSVVIKKLQPILVEAIVRGYLAGSGWKDYQQNSSICGIKLAPNLRNSQKLEHPIFTPSSKALAGEHDENINYENMQNLIGLELADKVKNASLKLYEIASAYALSKGIIIADTKFEFGLDDNNNLVLMDEILTPDSSRFWAIEDYVIGNNPPSFDKQFVRDWLEQQNWNKQAPSPIMPQNIIDKTYDKYLEIYHKLTNQELKI